MVAPHNWINPTPRFDSDRQDKWCHLYAKIFIICTLKLFLWEHSELLTWSEMAWESRGRDWLGLRWWSEGEAVMGVSTWGLGLRHWVSCQCQRKSCQGFPISSLRSGRWQEAEIVVILESYHQTAEAESYVLLHQYYLFSWTYVHNIRMFFYVLHCHLTFLSCDNTRISWKWSRYSEQDT